MSALSWKSADDDWGRTRRYTVLGLIFWGRGGDLKNGYRMARFYPLFDSFYPKNLPQYIQRLKKLNTSVICSLLNYFREFFIFVLMKK